MGSKESPSCAGSPREGTGESRKRKRPSRSDSDYEEEEDYSEEIEKKARLSIEEALSRFKIRICPSCKVRVTKGPGCDHIHCVCGANFCFRCGQHRNSCDCIRYLSRRVRTQRKPAYVVREACKRLKKRHPQLTFRQCCHIIAKSWTDEDKMSMSEPCDNDDQPEQE